MNPKNGWICVVFCSLVLVSGCNPKSSPTPVAPVDQAAQESVSSVPLRVTIVNGTGDHEMLKRQWLSAFEQPLEVKAMPLSEFLGASSCDCDVVLYPARLLGTLIQRGWLKRVKSATPGSDAKPADNQDAKPVPAAWEAQANYAGVRWARPLGCAIPVLLGGRQTSLDIQHGHEKWSQALPLTTGSDSISARQSSASPSKFDPQTWDAGALLDRFLAIACNLSPRSATYGLLFEMQTMKPRIAEEEFVEATQVLKALAAQSQDGVAAAGSWRDTWNWLGQDHSSAISVGLTGETGQGEAITTIRVSELPFDPSTGKKESPARRNWNTGAALLVSLSESCRQSARGEMLAEWLSKAATRDALAKSIPGVDAGSPVYGADSSAWQVVQLQRLISNRAPQPPEMRFPGTEEYRSALAKQLIRILTNQVDTNAGLGQVAIEWDAITDKLGRQEQRTQYEYSLGLTQ